MRNVRVLKGQFVHTTANDCRIIHFKTYDIHHFNYLLRKYLINFMMIIRQ